MNITQNLYKEDKELIKTALKLYKQSIKMSLEKLKLDSQDLYYKLHDLTVLEAFFNGRYKVTLSMTKEDFESFSSDNGVDFPEYTTDEED